jgi:two-component system, OmpR family, sensor kinase
LSLRTRLLIGLVALASLGLGAAALVTYEEQRSFLLTRLDQQVTHAELPVSVGLGLVHPPATRSAAVRPASQTFQVSGTYGVVLNAQGKVLQTRSFTYGESAGPPPAIGAGFPVSQLHASDIHLFTVGSKDGSGVRYRAAAFSLGGGRVLVIAVPLTEVDQTLQRLVVIEALVAGGVILALVALGWLVIRVGLRPLERIGRVASEIAHGDLSRRVDPANPKTELGRLGGSLNEMLGQIEQAFADRVQSEDRLRGFLADASHELRTPLASIRGYAELFRLGAVDDRASLERAMARIESEATRMGGLVEQLLLLARLDELPEMQMVPVDVVDLAEQVVQDARAMAPGRRVSVLADDGVSVLGDPAQLRQVLANLTRNAVIHSADDSSIEVTVRRRDGTAVIVVRDHGQGLPAGGERRVFERFWRADGGRSRGPGGAGLGLSIVEAIVHAHHGSVEAGNAPGGGAAFTVTLAAAPDDPRSDATLAGRSFAAAR